MNYYRRYVGDYGRKTTLLSLQEHGAYSLLLDHYYAEECPLPADMEDVYRIARAVKPDERRAVERVIAKYFTQEPDGFHNVRADEEIARAKPAIETAKRNGRKGGRPPKQNPLGYEDETHRDSYAGNPPGFDTPPILEPAGKAIRAGDPTTNHQPLAPNLQKPKVNNEVEIAVAESRQIATRVLAFLNEKTGRRYRAGQVHLDMILARIREGATETELRQVIAKKCREWKDDERMAQYLRPATLFNRTKFAQYQGELVVPQE